MTTTTTVLTQNLYPAGTHYSAPLAWQAGATSLTAGGLLSDQDAGAATNLLTLGIEVSFDGGKTYQPDGATAWVGGQLPKGATSGPPWALPALQISFASSQSPPTHARARVELPAPLSVGATLSFA